MDNDKTILNKNRIIAFFESDISVHVTLINKEWLNGKIISIKENFFILNERKKGPIPVLYSDIYLIDKLDESIKVDNSFIGEGILPEEKETYKWKGKKNDKI